jgi:NADPH:quinone reductase-like Zn-dependent oxidoreductase
VLRRGGHLVYLAAEPIVERGAQFGVRVTRAQIAPGAHVLAAVAELAERGHWRAQVSKLLPLRDAAEAHLAYERGQVTRGRIVLQIGAAGSA